MPAWAVRAGAREQIYFDPKHVTAAIVTCGGLCPGLNDVVQGIVKKLEDYGVPEGNILGIRYTSLLSVWHIGPRMAAVAEIACFKVLSLSPAAANW